MAKSLRALLNTWKLLNRTVYILGVSGQLGTLLAWRYLYCGFKVVGVSRSKPNIEHEKFKIVYYGDSFVLERMEDNSVLINAAANSIVRESISEDDVSDTFRYFKNILVENKNHISWAAHFVSSEMFGIPKEIKQDFRTDLSPINSYGYTKYNEKLECDNMVLNGFPLLCLGLFNFESPLRSEKFFTGKVIAFLKNSDSVLEVYNKNSQRDFGLATELVNYFVNEIMDAWIGFDFIGAQNPLTIQDFIIRSSVAMGFQLSEVQAERIVISNNKLTKAFVFVSNDILDEKRRFCYSGKGNFNNRKLAFLRGDDFFYKLIKEYNEFSYNTSTWWI